MSFAIEVPGEAIPLTPNDLCRVLQGATSHDYAQRQSAGQQLSSWESHRDYFVGLQAVFLDRSLPRDVRFLAIIQLKNGIDKYWRVTARNAIKPEQKSIIRSRIFQGSIEEDDKNLGLHNALAAAKIVRIDFPQDWPDALAGLIAMLRKTKQGNQSHLHGVLLILLRIVKELGSARLRKSQTALQGVAEELSYVAAEIYAEKASLWVEFLTAGRGGEDDPDMAMQNSLTALKLLRRLALHGFDYPHRNSVVQEFWSVTQNHFGQFLSFVSHNSLVPAPYQDDIGKHLLQFTKLHLEMADVHPASFAMLPNAMELCTSYWELVAKFSEVFYKSMGIRASNEASESAAKSKVEGPLLERLALKGLLLLKTIVRMVFWPQQSFKFLTQQTRAERDTAIESMKRGLLKDEFVIHITNVLITNLFVFRQSDLVAWEEDPQEWELQEHSQGSAWEWEVRPAAERLFLDLLSNYKNLLVPPLLSYVHTAMQADSDVVTKEKVYASIGLAAAHLNTAFDFNNLLTSTLVNDAQKTGPEYKILRRRIAIVISQWTSVQLADENKPLVYEIFRHFLNPSDATNDVVVQLTAARELYTVVACNISEKFNPEAFQPFALDIVTRLLALIDEAENDETRLAILSSLQEVVARMDDHVKSFSDLVIAALPGVWDNAGAEEYMIKQAVMAILTSLIMSMGADSPRYYSLVLPVLSQAIQPGSDLYLHLIEESLDLWEAILMQSTRPPAPEVVALAEMAVVLLENQTESIPKCLDLIKNYIILTPETMLSDKLRQPTLHALFLSLEARGREVIGSARHSIWMMIRFAGDLGGSDGLTAIVKDMVSNGFIAKIMEQIHDSWNASQTTGPNRKPSKLPVLTEIDYFLILGRIALSDPKIFVMMLSELGQLESLLSWFVSRWFANFDSMTNGEHAKESCLAITRLLELPSPVQDLVLSTLQEYFSMWTTVVTDVRSEANNGRDAYVWDNADERYDWETPLDVISRKTLYQWETHSIDTRDFIMARLNNLVARVGGEQAFQDQWVVNVDKDVVAGFQQLSVPQSNSDEAVASDLGARAS
ncbi:Armadillo-type fold protein [Zalerion maritima]|uniref:Armadillo-type fold protein n=1 Tax=Zalerion maritima TaxID=339359 RepID=A0AAD5WLK4_9PEZI|nr:Armadillo-type fold protein [Zalerion maritima]